MKSSPKGVGLFLAAVVIALLVVGSPGRREPDPEPAPESAAPAPGPAGPELPVFELVNGEWRMPAYHLSLRLPEGWTPEERRGRPYAYRDSEDPLGGSFNVLSLPNLRGLDFEALKEENQATMEGSEGLDLLRMEELEVSGRKALRIDYVGRPNGGEEMRFAGVVMLAGGKQLVVTAAARQGAWGEIEGEVEESLRSLRWTGG